MMQYPVANAHPFEFARLVLLMAAVAFCLGFGGYVALHPSTVTVAREAARPGPAHAPTTTVSVPLADEAAARRERT